MLYIFLILMLLTMFRIPFYIVLIIMLIPIIRSFRMIKKQQQQQQQYYQQQQQEEPPKSEASQFKDVVDVEYSEEEIK